MAPWDGVKRTQRKTTGRTIAKANNNTDAGFKMASQAILTAFKGSTCGCPLASLPPSTLSLTRIGAAPQFDSRDQSREE
jgi:hypothetical protein